MSSTWYNLYVSLVENGQMSLEQLNTALEKGRITQEEYEDLVSRIPE